MPDEELDALTERYGRNRQYAKPGTYTTRLSPLEEKQFQGWLFVNKIPFDTHWPPDQAMQDYDMRGYWKALKSGDPRAAQDKETMHFPDYWKTPYHETFSNQSIYAKPDAPRWKGAVLTDKDGKVIWQPPQ
jgi:hypothetical protein